MFWTVPLSIIRIFYHTCNNGLCHTVLLTASEQDQDGTSSSCSQAVSKPVWHIPLLCVQRKTPDDGQRNCPKCGVYSKNKFEKLMHLFGFVIRIHHDARSPERQNFKISVLSEFIRNQFHTNVMLYHRVATSAALLWKPKTLTSTKHYRFLWSQRFSKIWTNPVCLYI